MGVLFSSNICPNGQECRSAARIFRDNRKLFPLTDALNHNTQRAYDILTLNDRILDKLFNKKNDTNKRFNKSRTGVR